MKAWARESNMSVTIMSDLVVVFVILPSIRALLGLCFGCLFGRWIRARFVNQLGQSTSTCIGGGWLSVLRLDRCDSQSEVKKANMKDSRFVPEVASFHVQYSRKDSILYSLSIGEENLKYVFEESLHFDVSPLMALIFQFWATPQPQNNSRIPPFPPPLLKSMGVIPSSLLTDPDLSAYPVLHMKQSCRWIQSLPVPYDNDSIALLVNGKCISVVPKEIGTFVNTQTTVTHLGQPVCILESTMLVLGIDPDEVTPFDPQRASRVSSSMPHSRPTFKKRTEITNNQALLYRIASGDSNAIHVKGDNPLLHGLCTLAIVARELLSGKMPSFLTATFRKPVYMRDELEIEAWKENEGELSFRVMRDDVVVVDHGLIKLSSAAKGKL